jgi:methionyl aminopeptidase
VIVRKSAREVAQMRAAGDVVAETLELLSERIRPGVTTADLDRAADDHIRSRGGEPTFKGYRGYPAAICTSPSSSA